jgi:hypothetical protein
MSAAIGGPWNWVHVVIVAAGSAMTTSTAWSFLARAIDTVPVPDNEYARWLVSLAQWWIGQRERSINTTNNLDTVNVATVKKTSNGVH